MSRVRSYDYMRAAATFAVILIHTAAPILYLYNEMPRSDWMIGNAFDSAVRWCVPIFFMLSGAFLLQPNDESLKTFFFKRFNKVLIPLFIWSIIYYAFSLTTDNSKFSSTVLIKNFINDDVYFHLWFLYSILGLYLITPIIRILLKHLSQQYLLYFLFLWFLGTPVIDLLNHLFNLKIAIQIPISGYLGYFVLGYYLYNNTLKKKTRVTIYLLGLISYFVTVLGVYLETANAGGKFSGFYYNYLSPNTVFIAISIFLLFKHMKIGESKLYSLISFISNKGLGIYLIHALVLKLLSDNYNLNANSFNPIFSIPTVSMLTLIISCSVVFLLKDIPVIKRIVP